MRLEDSKRKLHASTVDQPGVLPFEIPVADVRFVRWLSFYELLLFGTQFIPDG
jgi:hypothetical protein